MVNKEAFHSNMIYDVSNNDKSIKYWQFSVFSKKRYDIIYVGLVVGYICNFRMSPCDHNLLYTKLITYEEGFSLGDILKLRKRDYHNFL